MNPSTLVQVRSPSRAREVEPSPIPRGPKSFLERSCVSTTHRMEIAKPCLALETWDEGRFTCRIARGSHILSYPPNHRPCSLNGSVRKLPPYRTDKRTVEKPTRPIGHVRNPNRTSSSSLVPGVNLPFRTIRFPSWPRNAPVTCPQIHLFSNGQRSVFRSHVIFPSRNLGRCSNRCLGSQNG